VAPWNTLVTRGNACRAVPTHTLPGRVLGRYGMRHDGPQAGLGSSSTAASSVLDAGMLGQTGSGPGSLGPLILNASPGAKCGVVAGQGLAESEDTY
jgi:hypothetical protein